MTFTPDPWWKSATVYQIYPASFKDSNNDGIGDIPGIISKLDYIQSLGVDVVWLCPMYDSPQYDMGYDISAYDAVYKPYGTLQDMEVLINQCHERGLKIILDLVVNHTSHEHKWFKESRSSKSSPKRDWYIWQPARYDSQGKRKPPNNWRSNFGGSTWTWDEETQEYYLHLFCPEQPDLNWENPETRKAIYDEAVEFWLKKGVDGFRIDTVNMYSKFPGYADAPITDQGSEYQFAASLYCNGPRMHEYLREMGEVLDRYGAMTVGELPHTPSVEKVLKYVSAREKQLNMVFQFDVVDLGMGASQKYDTTPRNWRLPDLKQAFTRCQSLMDGTDAWTTSFLENHDQGRSISRFGSDKTPELRDRSGKMLAMMLATLSGTLYIYQGQELGMVNVPASWPVEEYKDVESSNYYNAVKDRTGSDPAALRRAKAALQHLARDHARVPMQWDDSAYAGFTTSESAEPWMRVNDNYTSINAAQQEQDGTSILAFWRKMLKLRKEYPSLFVHGEFEVLDEEDENVFAFRKRAGEKQILVLLNFTEHHQTLELLNGCVEKGTKLLGGNYDSTAARVLKPFEGRIYLE